jgi:hypothetical protein
LQNHGALVDGTYELFRHFYGQCRFNGGRKQNIGASIGVLNSVLDIFWNAATHIWVSLVETHVRFQAQVVKLECPI